MARIEHVETPVRVVFDVFGVYTHGALAGKTNPASSVKVTVFGQSFKDCKDRINSICEGALWKVAEVTEDLEFTGAHRLVARYVK